MTSRLSTMFPFILVKLTLVSALAVGQPVSQSREGAQAHSYETPHLTQAEQERKAEAAAAAEQQRKAAEQQHEMDEARARSRKEAEAAAEDEKHFGGWRDPASGLVWARHDNGSELDLRSAKEYCRNLNLGGDRDWRLPTTFELHAIYDSEMLAGQYHIRGGIELSGPCIWAAQVHPLTSYEVDNFTLADSGSSQSLGRCMDSGLDDTAYKNSGYVLCVRGPIAIQTAETAPGHKSESIAAAEKDIWTSPVTALMWTKSVNQGYFDWAQANSYCHDLNLDGYTGWRLPTIQELQGVYDPKQNSIKICQGLKFKIHSSVPIEFGAQCVTELWSSSLDDASGKAWAFEFQLGGSFPFPMDLGGNHALCVRDSRK